MTSTGLDAIATPAGTFAVLAMDQRGTLKRMLAAVDRTDTSDAEIVAMKRDMIASLAGSASAFLIDPTFGLPAAREVEGVPPFGLLLAAEPASRGTHLGEPEVALDPAQDAAWVRDSGADGMKFLAQVRADRPVGEDGRDLTGEAREAMRTLVEDCAAQGVPSIIENLIYPLRGEAPLSPEEFTQVLRISCDEGGASGFIAGRAVWKETVSMDHDERVAFLSETGRRRMDEYTGIIEGRARPYKEAVA